MAISSHVRDSSSFVFRLYALLQSHTNLYTLPAGNIVKIVIEGTAFWILIDLDASCNLGELAGQKVTSTAFFPPEMARRELNNKPESDIEIVPASKQFEMWYLGLLLLQLCTKDAPTLWQSTQADNILEAEDMQSLAHFWDALKVQKVSKIKGKQWAPAADLTLWLLQEKASRRPESMSVVFDHKFFTDGGSLRFLKSVDETMNDFEQRQARELATAIEGVPTAGSNARVKEVLDAGGAHVNLALEGSTVLPIHRAARLGLVELIDLLLAEVHREAWPRVLDTQTEFNFTALHWCVVYGVDDHDGRYAAVADKLIVSGADTSLVNNRGKTAWELALQTGAKTVQEKFQRHAKSGEPNPSSGVASVFQRYADAADPCMVAFYSTLNKQAQTTTQLVTIYSQKSSLVNFELHQGLQQEQQRRALRPDVAETFRDDLELDPKRFTFWDIEPFSCWGKKVNGRTKPLAEGGFGKVYLVNDVFPIEVAGRMFTKVVMKVPKPSGVVELKGEVESLGGLAHPNVVQILGMVKGLEPDGTEAWMMPLEYCLTDLQKVVHGKAQTDAACKSFDEYTGTEWVSPMVDFAEQIATGFVYIHGEGRPHLDIKPENILLAKEDDSYVCKLADFGMVFQPTTQQAIEPAGASESPAPGSTEEAGLVWTHSPSAEQANAGATTLTEDKPYGTWEYMAPESWKRKYGKPGFESDIFSFGMMLWEMVARKRIYSGFPGFYQDKFAPTSINEKTGKKEIDVKQIAERLAVKEQRPPSAWTGSDDLEHHYPALLYMLMQACLVPEMSKRPKAEDVLDMLAKLQKYPGAIHPTREVEPDLPHLSYAGFLEQLGLQDKKQELSDCGLDDGLELKQLVEMDDTDLNDDILADEDLELDEDTKAKFRDAVEALRTVAAATEADECSAAQGPTAVEMHAAWDTLTRELGGEAADSFGTLAAAVAEIERLRERLREEKDEELAANAKELAAKDGIIAQKDGQLAEKDGVIAQKDGQLAEKDGQLAANAKELVEKDGQLVANAKEIVEKDGQLAEKDEQLVANAKEIVEKDGQLAANVKELAANAKELEQLREQLER